LNQRVSLLFFLLLLSSSSLLDSDSDDYEIVNPPHSNPINPAPIDENSTPHSSDPNKASPNSHQFIPTDPSSNAAIEHNLQSTNENSEATLTQPLDTSLHGPVKTSPIASQKASPNGKDDGKIEEEQRPQEANPRLENSSFHSQKGSPAHVENTQIEEEPPLQAPHTETAAEEEHTAMNIEDERPIKPFNTNFNAAQAKFDDVNQDDELRIADEGQIEQPPAVFNNDDERPIKPRASPTEFEEEKQEQRVPSVTSDDRPLPGKGSYKFTENITPAKQADEIGDEQMDLAVRSRTLTASSKTSNTIEDNRPLKGATTYNIPEEQPVSSKGSYDLVSEERPVQGKVFTAKSSRSKGKASVDEKFDEKPLSSKGAYNMMDERPLGGGNNFNDMDERPIGGGNNFNEMDERPIGGGNNFGDERPLKSGQPSVFDLPENAGTEMQEEQSGSAQDSGPLSSRVKSKVWKVRQSAFEELIRTFNDAKPKDSVFYEYSGELSKFIADANPGAQEKAIEALKIYLQKQGTDSLDTRSTLKTLIDKALGPGKPSVKKTSNEVLCLLFEKGDNQAIYDAINDSINHKNQKTSLAGVQAVTELLTNYGAKKLDYLKPFLPNIEKLAGSTVSALRTEAMNFYKEAYKFMGDAIRPFLVKLKKAQQDELEKFFSENPTQTSKPLRSAAADPQAGSSGDTTAMQEETNEPEIDPYDIMDPVDIFKRFNEAWCDKVLEQPKWSDKKALLEDLLKEASTTVKIANTPHQHMAAMGKRILNDSNITVMVTGIKVYAALAKGLRRNFSMTCKITVPVLLSKLKDKRAQTIEETCKALDNFLYCITLDEITEDLKDALNDKAPEIKIHTVAWIDRFCEKNRSTPEKITNLYKNLLPTAKKLVNDSSGDVRESVMKLLAKWKVFLGDNVIKESYNDIPQPKLQRINELVANLGDGGRGTAKSAASGSCATPIANKAKASFSDSMEEEKVNTRPATRAGDVNRSDNKAPMRQRPGTAAGPASKLSKQSSTKRGSTKPATNASALATKPEEEAHSVLTQEDAEAKMMELGLAASVLKDMDNNNWKEKLKGLNQLSQWIGENMSLVAPYLEHIFRYLKAKLKDWKESNLNILKETFSLLITMVKSPEVTLNKRAFSILSPLIAANISDSKYNESCQTIVYAFIEAMNPKAIVLSLIHSTVDKNAKPNPKALVEMSNLFTKLVEELTLKFIPLKELIDCGKFVISNQNPACRTAATNLFKAIYQQMGPPLTDMINDVNPQTLKALTAEFDKIVPIKDVQCKIQFREDADSEIKDMANANPLDSLPRADISRDVEKLYKKLTDNDWKVRKEGLDALDGLVNQANGRILPNGLYDLVAILKTRLNENNKSQAKSFISFVGKFATALGPGAKVHAKVLVPELIRNLSDKQTAIRQEALSSLQKFMNEIGSVMIINSMFPLLNLESPEMRSEIMNWILRNPEDLAKAELKQNIAPLLNALQDKTKEIRALAEKVLEKCIAVTGSGPYLSAVKDLKPAIQKALKPIVEKYQSETAMETENLESTMTSDHTQKNLKKAPSEANLKARPPVQKNATPTSHFNPNHSMNAGYPPHQQQQQQSGQKPSKNASPRKATVGHPPAHHRTNLSDYTPLNNSMNAGGQAPASNNIINLLGQKQRRQEEEKRSGWSTDELQDEAVDSLKGQFKMNVSPDLYVKMFSVDSKKHIDAINILKKALIVEFQGTIDILDMICKWFFLRLWDNSNPQLMKESLDYIFSLILSLEAAQYTLLDFEANTLIACLIPKLGSSQQSFQITLHKVFTKLAAVYPPQKLAVFLLHGMNSKNSQTRLECIDVLAKVIQISGPAVLTQKDIRIFGKLLGHVDQNIKNRSMQVIVELGKHMGENVLTIIQNDAPAQIVEELHQKIQASNDVVTNENQMQEEVEEQQEQPLYNPTSPNKVLLEIKNALGNDAGNNEQEEVKGNNENNYDQEGNYAEEGRANNMAAPGLDSEQFDKSVQLLINGTVSNKLDALLFIHDIATSENEENKQFLKEKSDMLIQALKMVLAEVFEKPRKEIPAKFLIYFLNMTHKLCSIRVFLKSVTEDNLREFSEEILNRLLSEDEVKEGKVEDKQLDKVENESLVKTLNSTMLRILENADPNDMLCVLFDLLIKNRRRITNYSKILGLIIKCILKLTKALEQLVNVIQPEKILLKSHLYLLEFGTDPSKLGEDIGIKTIKTILNELVKLYKERIWEFYAKSVQTHPRQDNYIHKWIVVILRPFIGNNTISPRFPNQTSPRGRGFSAGERPPNMNNTSMTDMNQDEIPAIREIIERLKRSDNFEEGIKQLYDILQQYPEHSIAPYFRDCTKTFADYVTLALERQRFQRANAQTQNENEGRNTARAFGLQNRMNMPSDQLDTSKDYTQANPNLQDLHNKVNSLKIRYGLIAKNDSTGPNNENQNANIMSMGYTNRVALNTTNANQMEAEGAAVLQGNEPGLTGGQAGGQGQSKTTEALLQKLSEMKLKMTNIVKSTDSSN